MKHSRAGCACAWRQLGKRTALDVNYSGVTSSELDIGFKNFHSCDVCRERVQSARCILSIAAWHLQCCSVIWSTAAWCVGISPRVVCNLVRCCVVVMEAHAWCVRVRVRAVRVCACRCACLRSSSPCGYSCTQVFADARGCSTHASGRQRSRC